MRHTYHLHQPVPELRIFSRSSDRMSTTLAAHLPISGKDGKLSFVCLFMWSKNRWAPFYKLQIYGLFQFKYYNGLGRMIHRLVRSTRRGDWLIFMDYIFDRDCPSRPGGTSVKSAVF